MAKAIKILQVNVCLNVLSTGRITEQIGESVIEEGWNSHVLTYGPLKKSTSHVIKVKGGVEHYIHRVINRFFDSQGLGSYFSTKKAIKEIEVINPDIIHLQNIHDCWLNHPLFFKYIIDNRKPVVWTFHDCWSITGHCAYFDDVDCKKWKTGCYNCPLKNKPSLDRSKYNYVFKKNLYSQIDDLTIVPVSHWLENIAKESFLKNRNVFTIHNGIDLDLFKPRESNLRKMLGIADKFVVLGVSANWGWSKGLYDFVELSKNREYKVILIGVPEDLKKELPNEIINITRTDSQEQLAEYYTMADVFVNPTYHDNYPTVNLEAIACGTPMVGYRTGGSPEALYDEESGFNKECGIIVEKGNYKTLRQAIETIRLESDEERTKRRMACRKHAEKNFDKSACYKKYIDLYKEILEK